MRRAGVAGAAVAAMVGWCMACGAASATTMPAVGLEQLFADSALVVRGRVLGQRGVWDGVRERVYTDSQLLVDAVWAYEGTAAAPSVDAVVVRQLGGRVGDVVAHVDGVGALAPGDEVVLFLREVDGRFYLVGMAQGRFLVRRGGGAARAEQDLDGLSVVGGRAALPGDIAALRDRVTALAAASPHHRAVAR